MPRVVICLFAFVPCAAASAQVPSALPPLPTANAPAPAPSPDPNAGKRIYGEQPLFVEEVVAADADPRWRTDLMFGAPTAIRFQRQFDNRRLWFEGGAGFYLIWPTVFAGLRAEGALYDGASDAFSVRPGLTAYYLQGWRNDRRGRHNLFDDAPSGLMVALDFDLNWKHRWHRRLHGELALKLGAGTVFANGYAAVLPLAGLSFGVNY